MQPRRSGGRVGAAVGLADARAEFDVVPSAAALVAALAAVAGGLLAAAGIAVLGRRLAGALAAEPRPAVAWTVAGVGLAAVAAVDLAVRKAGPRWPAFAVRCGVAAVALAVLPLAGTSTRSAGLTAAGCLVAVAATLVPPRRRIRRRPPAASPIGGDRPAHEHPGPPSETASPTGRREPPTAADAWLAAAPSLRQRLERYETPTGADALRGLVVLAVEPGARLAHAHVGFCPAFAATPTVDVETAYDGVEVTVAAAEVLPWGVRVECRLADAADEPLAIPVEIRARAPE